MAVSELNMELKGARVLVVEDDPIVAMAANMMVEELGGVVADTAGSAAAAGEKLAKTAFDCVVLDINLRGEMTLEVAAELEVREIPYVFCTAYTHTFDGFEHVPRVTKPYCVKGLGVALNKAFAQRSGRTLWKAENSEASHPPHDGGGNRRQCRMA